MLTAPADALYVYANSVKIVQEFFYMRLGACRWVTTTGYDGQEALPSTTYG